MKFEQFVVGDVVESGEYLVAREELTGFARQYDPQPMHVDADSTGGRVFGDVIASGFHTLAIAWRLWIDQGLLGDDGEAGLGLLDVRWLEPVFADDRLRTRTTIKVARETSKGRGFVRFGFEVLNQRGATVATFDSAGFMAREGA